MTRELFFDSAGVNIHYMDQGAGPPVVLLHGLLGTYTAHWVDTGVVQALLDGGYRVLALDARAHGLSGCPHDPNQYGNEMVLDIVRLLGHVGLDKAHVVGYSMGAAIANKLRELQPDRLISLTLAANGWVKDNSPGPVLTALADSLDAGGGFMPLFNALYPDWPERERQARSDARMKTLPDARALVAYLRGEQFGVAEQSLRKNTVPTLGIVGSRDPMKLRADMLVGAMQNYMQVVIPEADHATTLAHPQFMEILLKFLSGHPG